MLTNICNGWQSNQFVRFNWPFNHRHYIIDKFRIVLCILFAVVVVEVFYLNLFLSFIANYWWKMNFLFFLLHDLANCAKWRRELNLKWKFYRIIASYFLSKFFLVYKEIFFEHGQDLFALHDNS